MLVLILFVTTPLGINNGWLCCKEFEKQDDEMKCYRIESCVYSTVVKSFATAVYQHLPK